MINASFEWVRLYQIDRPSGETAVFSVNRDGTWEDAVDGSSGHVTAAELKDLSKLFKNFEKSHFTNGPVVGDPLTAEDYYNLDSAAKAKHDTSNFFNVVYDDGPGPTLEYGPVATVAPLDAFMQHLATVYGDGVIV